MPKKLKLDFTFAHDYLLGHPEGVSINTLIKEVYPDYNFNGKSNAFISTFTNMYFDVYEDDNNLFYINYDILKFNERQNYLNDKFKNIKRKNLTLNELEYANNENIHHLAEGIKL